MNFRSKKLLDFAKKAPHCMNIACGVYNHGQVVGAHSNFIRHGKGKGIKAHDLPAYLCHTCHGILDGQIKSDMTKAEKELMFLDAVYASTVWLLQSGYLKVTA